MPDDHPVYYWDSCVFLSYINGTADRLPDIDALLDRSGKDFQVITSTVTIVEVAFGKLEQDNETLDEVMEARISGLWGTDSPVKIVEFFPVLAQAAKELMRQGRGDGLKLKPMDAIHLATAKHFSAARVHTYDEKLEKYEDLIGIPIGPPLATAPKLL